MEATGEHTGPSQCSDGASHSTAHTVSGVHRPVPSQVLQGPWIFWVRGPVLHGCSHLSPWLRGDVFLDLVSISVSLSALMSPSVAHVTLILACLSCSPAVSHKPRTSRNLLRKMPCQWLTCSRVALFWVVNCLHIFAQLSRTVQAFFQQSECSRGGTWFLKGEYTFLIER